ncbi:MAG: hypothetical protein J1E63_09430 [Muribaculaceae bacterium]|nr:hypothetical protein [Muribaculaceae bacterium]
MPVKSFAKQLFEEIIADPKKYIQLDKKDRMAQTYQNDSNQSFLLNKKEKEAWRIVDNDYNLTMWDLSDVEVASLFNMPEEARSNAMQTYARYSLRVDHYADGVGLVSWTLQPDGQYWADSDGFGGTNDVEYTVYAYIDTKGRILIPFQPMEDYDLRKRYHAQALKLMEKPDETFYICLAPELTIPTTENTNLAAHSDLLSKLIRGAMIRFATIANNLDAHPEHSDGIAISTSFNPDEKEYLLFSLFGEPTGEDDQYELKVALGYFKEGQDPQGCLTPFGKMSLDVLADAMTIEANVDLFINEIINSADLIFSGKLPQ